MTRKSTRLFPLLAVVLVTFGAAKTFDIWVSFSSAGAVERDVEALSVNDDNGAAGSSSPVERTESASPETESSRHILEALAQRREQIELKEAELETREALILAAESELQKRIDEYRRIQREVETLVNQQSEKQTAELNELVTAYERMRAKDAAIIFNQLDEKILVAVASEMRPQALASVLAAMEPERARTLTTRLAGNEEFATTSAGAE